MKFKPFTSLAARIATTILVTIPRAATQANSPTINPNPPSNSAAIARSASGTGIFICAKEFIVAVKTEAAELAERLLRAVREVHNA